MNEYRLIITKHAYKRYRQRVGSLPFRVLRTRCQTALLLGHYRHGHGVIKLHGSWWGCTIKSSVIILATCYGHQDRDMIRERERHAVST